VKDSGGPGRSATLPPHHRTISPPLVKTTATWPVRPGLGGATPLQPTSRQHRKACSKIPHELFSSRHFAGTSVALYVYVAAARVAPNAPSNVFARRRQADYESGDTRHFDQLVLHIRHRSAARSRAASAAGKATIGGVDVLFEYQRIHRLMFFQGPELEIDQGVVGVKNSDSAGLEEVHASEQGLLRR